jgi:hypothetical protein
MKNNIFTAQLARGAMASALVGVSAMPSHHALTVAHSVVAQELTCSNRAEFPEATTRTIENGLFVMTMTQAPSTWDKKLEREFRKLALEEAKGTIAGDDARRLNQLNHWRDQLLSPLTSDEILLQMKRDRLLERMEILLKEYVELQEAANQTRTAA